MRRDTFQALLSELDDGAHSSGTLSARFGLAEGPVAVLLEGLAERGVLLELMPGLYMRTPRGTTQHGEDAPIDPTEIATVHEAVAPDGWGEADAPTLVEEDFFPPGAGIMLVDSPDAPSAGGLSPRDTPTPPALPDDVPVVGELPPPGASYPAPPGRRSSRSPGGSTGSPAPVVQAPRIPVPTPANVDPFRPIVPPRSGAGATSPYRKNAPSTPIGVLNPASPPPAGAHGRPVGQRDTPLEIERSNAPKSPAPRRLEPMSVDPSRMSWDRQGAVRRATWTPPPERHGAMRKADSSRLVLLAGVAVVCGTLGMLLAISALVMLG
ncbi:MAG: hypothetical protein ACI8PZ_004797 [Myxococcota bacterium]|jgi:hypothetical protein